MYCKYTNFHQSYGVLQLSSHPTAPPPPGAPQRHPHVTSTWTIALAASGGWEEGGGEHGLAQGGGETGGYESSHGAVTWVAKWGGSMGGEDG